MSAPLAGAGRERHETDEAQNDEDDAGGSSDDVVALLPPRAGWRLVLL